MSAPLRALLEGLAVKRLSADNPKEHVLMNEKNILVSLWQVVNDSAKLRPQNSGMKLFRCHDLGHSRAYNFLLKVGQPIVPVSDAEAKTDVHDC